MAPLASIDKGLDNFGLRRDSSSLAVEDLDFALVTLGGDSGKGAIEMLRALSNDLFCFEFRKSE